MKSLTSFLSFRFVSMTTVATFCSHIILQKSAVVSSFGPVRQKRIIIGIHDLLGHEIDNQGVNIIVYVSSKWTISYLVPL